MPITYNIYRDGVKIQSGITSKFFVDEDVQPNTVYTYQVSAENQYGESELSDSISVQTDYSDVEHIVLDKESLLLEVGEKDVLSATVIPPTANQEVVWSSDNEGVATVDDSEVTAISEGTAVISATSISDPTMEATCTVEVFAPNEEDPEEE